jgi:hypothetical protein
MKFYFYFYFSLLSVYTICQNQSETKNVSNNENFDDDNILESKELNLTIDEMDKMMLCSVFIQEALRKDKDRIEALANKTNSSDILVFEKLGTDIFEYCYNNIDMTTVRKYFNNLTYLGGYEWKKEFDNYIEINYDKYLEKKNFELTNEQLLLSQNFNLVKEKFKKKQLEQREKIKEEHDKLKIGNFDFENIPSNIKGIIFIIVFMIIFGGSILLLKSLINKPKKKKENKKKTQ